MNIFDLRQRLITDYSSYIKSFIRIHDPEIEKYVENKLFQNGMLWPEALIQLNPMFEPGKTVDELVRDGVLHPTCAQIFRRNKSQERPEGLPLHLHKHQAEAIDIARTGHSYVLTTGTGSGKSLAYIVPIVDYVLRNPDKPGIKAIVVYPMNALANSQLGELQKYLQTGLSASRHSVRFARYTGQETAQEREEIIAYPPDILLTNYVMLELILTRSHEQRMLSSAQLRFLVLDELHTYRGRQGADVSLLVRRVRNRLTPAGKRLQCVGTSATLAGEGPYEEQRRDVARMATRIFGTEVLPAHIISESLVRVTRSVDEQAPEFLRQLTERVTNAERKPPLNYDEFLADPLSIWLESTFGIRMRDGRLVRTVPRQIGGERNSAAAALRTVTGASLERCVAVIKEGLLAGYEEVKDPITSRAPFAFRLHQFISKGDTVYATLEYAPQRHLTLQRQQFVPGDRGRILLPLAFCRECGQHYYCVRWQGEQSFIWRELQDQSREREEDRSLIRSGIPGFLYLSPDHPWPSTREGIDRDLPGEWKETRNGKEQIIPSARKNRPVPLLIRPDGTVVEEHEEGVLCHFIPTPFRFCLRCGVSYGSYQKEDFSKLSLLSSEGRSTATTILSLSTIRHLRESRESGAKHTIEPKMLSFTDNRQDASLQAGHFNDFVEIGLLRSALYRAVEDTGEAGLQHDTLALKVFAALKLPPDQYAVNKELKYSVKNKTEQAMRNVLGYHLYLDLRRGWRITSPNLEQCGLLVIDYQDLELVCEDEQLWRDKLEDCQDCHDALKVAPPTIRKEICRTLLDYMRRELAIKVDYLTPSRQEEIKQQSSQHLLAPWAIDEDEEMQFATILFPRSRGQEDDRSFRYLSGLSSFGRYVRRILREIDPQLKPPDAQKIIEQLLERLQVAGLVEKVMDERYEKDVAGYQLPASTIIWRAGAGTTAYHDPMRMPNLPRSQDKHINYFFREFYKANAEHIRRIQQIHAFEHTAQVPSEEREEREKAFRAGNLPILYCSPTMELGVDIAELNVVNMRNIPPTPANYAQRSGRAGRSGQPALVFSYCSTGSSHDQHFFQHPEAMVKGAVTPPRIDLTNEDLIRAHVHAIWLAETGLSLEQSLKDLLDVAGENPSLELLDKVKTAITNRAARQRAELRAREILKTLLLELENREDVRWYSENWLSEQLRSVGTNFDKACERWRGLYRAAQAQRDEQNRVIGDASRTAEDKKLATRLRSEAESQLALLTTADKSERSEFYSYRYFASEGFLPGYNFPRLPLSAYVPGRRTKQRDEYLSRPRFLAISEFAPRAIIYHEGSRYIINRAILSVQQDGADVQTNSAKQCTHCGYLHPSGTGESLDVCVYCHKPLNDALQNLFRLQSVSTRRKDKINSDEEERMRQGYEIRTAVRFPERDGRPSYFEAYVESDGVPLARLTYGQSAALWRINLGPTRRKNKDILGFTLDMERGYWGKDDDPAEDPSDPMSGRKKRVIPYVEDTRNCLLFEPLVVLGQLGLKEMASLQAALKSALQVHYQLEDNEMAAEPLPGALDRRLLLFYEASEGGAGVLRQLIDNPTALADVAREALSICHYDAKTFDDLRLAEHALEECEAACYNCLMTYANQRDHRMLDRSSIKDVLAALTQSRVSLNRSDLSAIPGDALLPMLEANSDLERRWLDMLAERGYRYPTVAHTRLGSATPDFFYDGDMPVAIYVDGSDPDRQARSEIEADDLMIEGYMVLRFADPDEWDALFKRYPRIFG